ncbi:retinal short-chain dehydrogenase/reductase, putative [Cryptococcus deneoformans JEC21]|uniref:Short-chain dehydrogenase/reductase 3 n=1 Tax=Cryptococcus deneoformans (strain JEC21 / ATCC MYA-565) TaxID=214684 RepID=Q5KCS6_CRYD1|nr:retinal short-chain dehydrogenase/reductase, putative [Cryptococcus neoformans var. neoformans JEC21]AAW45076.2 retinal short-chain dehydrogenase/reductase, putative [Cryptococcus neoformans var. neoformans JEC21]
MALTLDIVVCCLRKTIFSPYLAISIPVVLHLHSISSRLVLIVSYFWGVVICFIRLLCYADWRYANQAPWFHAPPKLQWEDQVVLITGGGSGIGALLAQTLANRNVAVAILTKDLPKQPFSHSHIHVFACDVSDYNAVMGVSARVREAVGDPTIIINNAGIVSGKLLLDLTEEDITSTFGSNTLAHFWVLKAFLPAMLRRGRGHIVTMSSILGIVGAAQMTDYCASKAAVLSLHQTLRFELDSRYQTPGIRTTLVLPAYTLTSLFNRVKLPTNRLFDFLCPPVQPRAVVEHIISALDDNESRIIRLPFYSNFARLCGDAVGLVPAGVRDFVQWLSGADYAMKGYGPTPDAGERLLAERQSHTPLNRKRTE